MTIPDLAQQLAQLEQAMRRQLLPPPDPLITTLITRDAWSLLTSIEEWADTLHALQQPIQDETTTEKAQR